MKRLVCFAIAGFAIAMGLGTSAHADSLSFVVAGHMIRIAASRHCYSTSCVSVSIPGVFTSHRKHSDAFAAQDIATVKPAALPASVAPVTPGQPQTAAPAVLPASAPPQLAAAESRAVPAPPRLPAEPVKTASRDSSAPAQPTVALPTVKPSVEEPFVERPPTEPASATVLNAEPAVQTALEDSPLGDWQTEGKTGQVRVEACGKALCGYLLNPSSHQKAEAILINMKPTGDSQWRGSIFSRASGNTYNATITLKSADLLRVEACALGHFFCTRNNWTRIVKTPAALVTSRESLSEPRS